jgi:hypothetical protein
VSTTKGAVILAMENAMLLTLSVTITTVQGRGD